LSCSTRTETALSAPRERRSSRQRCLHSTSIAPARDVGRAQSEGAFDTHRRFRMRSHRG
jgi:hypothetical protein